MKNIHRIGLLMGAPLLFGLENPGNSHRELKEPRPKKSKQELYNLKEFTIDGITVLARNEKNAIRKVNNIKNKNR